jgi:hypothetical protein
MTHFGQAEIAAYLISSTAEDLLKYAQLNMHDEKPYLSLCHDKYANVSSMLANMLVSLGGYKKI